MKKIIVISDVDGCLTNGTFVYTADGKVSKTFGANDNEGVKLLRKNGIEVEFITADTIGEPITRKRIEDMNCQLTIVKECDRSKHIMKYLEDGYSVVFFGDGVGDSVVAKKCSSDAYDLLFVTPQNGRRQCKELANHVCEHSGGDGAFQDLAYYVVQHYFWNTYKELYE